MNLIDSYVSEVGRHLPAKTRADWVCIKTGESDKPRADYSIAAYANGMRDLMSVLDIERATVVGHSLGGGVAMQFAYQFPHLVERLVL